MSGPSVQVFFPFSPEHMTWDSWNGNLAIYYGELHIPFHSEEDWKVTARIISGNSAFSEYPVPHPDNYEEWQQWAKDFTEIVNGQSY